MSKIPADHLKYIINKFVEPPINWGKEMRLVKSLVKNFERMDFWCYRSPKKFPSLACMLTPNAKQFLTKCYRDYILENPQIKEYNLEEKPISTNLIETQTDRPKSLMEFLK